MNSHDTLWANGPFQELLVACGEGQLIAAWAEALGWWAACCSKREKCPNFQLRWLQISSHLSSYTSKWLWLNFSPSEVDKATFMLLFF